MNLDTALKQLRLSALGQTLSGRLQEAAANRLSHAEFLELILHDEINVREQRKIARRTVAAEFTSLKKLEDFDWRFNAAISRKDLFELAACHFVRKATDVLFVGPPGVGKTHLAQAIGYEAIKQGFVVRYRSIFDLVADFLSEEALAQHAPLRNTFHDHDQQPSAGGLGQTAPGRTDGWRHPRPLPPSRSGDRHHRQKLPAQGHPARQNQVKQLHHSAREQPRNGLVFASGSEPQSAGKERRPPTIPLVPEPQTLSIPPRREWYILNRPRWYTLNRPVTVR